jgi:DNA polymerase-1
MSTGRARDAGAARPTLFLIDGSSQVYRAYHAFRGQGLSNQEGRPTHAVYVFVTMLRKLIADHAPTHIAASFDLAGPTFRDAIADDYKANRPAMPDELAEQIAWVHEACAALGVPVLTLEGYEADDVIGTLAAHASAAGLDVAIVSIDKDFFQLVRDGAVRVYDPRDDGAWFDEQGVAQKFGVRPAQVIDVLALVGDTSDNVAGVPGIGRKGAVDLLTRYESLEELLAHTSELKPRQRAALETHATEARRSRQLVTIRTDAPIPIELDSLRYRGASRERCYELFTRLGFRSLVNEFAPSASDVPTDYALVTTEQDLDALVTELEGAAEFAFRLFTDRRSAMRAAIVGIACAAARGRARYVPFREAEAAAGDLLATEPAPPRLEGRHVLARLAPVFASEAIGKRGHDLKFDVMVLARHDVEVRGLRFDSMLAGYLLDATRPSPSLEDVALEQLGYRAGTEEALVGKGARAVPFSTVAPAAALAFAGERADLAWQLADALAPRLAEEKLDRLFHDLELPLVPVLVALERAGVLVDRAELAAQSAKVERDLAAITARIHELAGEAFNINSPAQLGHVLFEKLDLPAARRTGKTKAASTAAEVLEELALAHELPRLVLDWRALQKLRGTYLEALPAMIDPSTGRVHTSFNQAVAATGRLSSSDPNLQNIPIRKEQGREIRRAFTAPPGHVLISADYSQIELRVLAHMACEQALIDAFRAGEDIHTRTAERLFGLDTGIDPHELRSRSKMVNYAVLYGKSAFTLARDINVPQEAAQEFVDAYFSGFPHVRAFIDRTLEEGRRTGMVYTMSGRRRPVPNLTSRNFQMRSQAEREAVNMPIQGTAADILKQAMLEVHTGLPAAGLDARMILTVHDELLFECAEAQADEAVALVRRTMEGAASLDVPLTVDVGVGKTWKDAKG